MYLREAMKTLTNNSGESLNRFPVFEQYFGPSKQTPAPPPPKLKREACPTGKAPFRSKREADERALLLRTQARARPSISVYFCFLCSRWHTTSKPRY
jgi:hypothetical protein